MGSTKGYYVSDSGIRRIRCGIAGPSARVFSLIAPRFAADFPGIRGERIVTQAESKGKRKGREYAGRWLQRRDSGLAGQCERKAGAIQTGYSGHLRSILEQVCRWARKRRNYFASHAVTKSAICVNCKNCLLTRSGHSGNLLALRRQSQPTRRKRMRIKLSGIQSNEIAGPSFLRGPLSLRLAAAHGALGKARQSFLRSSRAQQKI